ncbi:MAG: PQQ-binding-like beta-propeller repeat protein [Verrucomicrobiota bacterium]
MLDTLTLNAGPKVGQGCYTLIRTLGPNGMCMGWLAQTGRLHNVAALKFPPFRTFLIGCLILLLNLSPAAAAASEPTWPTFHGPNRDNLVTEIGLMKTWPAEGPKLLWSFPDCGRGYAGMSIAEGLVFTSGDFGEDEYLLALDLAGKLKWKTRNGKAWKGATPGSRTTPTYSDGRVFHLGPHGDLSAFDAATGRVIWTVNIKDTFDAPLGGWGYTENLLVDADKVFCMPGGTKGKVVALDTATGKVRWANTEITDRAGYSSPIIVEHGGTRQFVTLARSTFLGVDIQSGKLLWSHPHPGFCDQNVTSPIYHDGCVFVTSGHRAGGRVIRLSADNRRTEELWYGKRLDNCHGGVVLLDGYLYGSGCRMYNKGLHCVEFNTGKVMYQAEAIGKASITYADERLFCVGNDGDVMLAKLSPQSADIVSQFKLPRRDELHTLSHPVVCGGRLYIRHLNDLWVYDVRAE